jgi:hypothetical protein
LLSSPIQGIIRSPRALQLKLFHDKAEIDN